MNDLIKERAKKLLKNVNEPHKWAVCLSTTQGSLPIIYGGVILANVQRGERCAQRF